MRQRDKPTRAQLDVLEWLLNYPGITIIYSSDMARNRACWSAYWASERSRQEMTAVMFELGSPMHGETEPMRRPKPCGTPRITDGTFMALYKRGWLQPLEMTRYRARSCELQISSVGAAAARSHLQVVEMLA